MMPDSSLRFLFGMALALALLCQVHGRAGAGDLLSPLIAESVDGTRIIGSEILGIYHTPIADVPRVMDFIRKHRDHRSYLLLFALRRHHPETYRKIPEDVRAAILCSALMVNPSLNDLGSPADKDWDPTSEPEQALREIGSRAIKYLLPLLDEHCAAKYEESGDTDYALSDVAFRLISLLLGMSPDFQAGLSERDEATNNLRRELVLSPNCNSMAISVSKKSLEIWTIRNGERVGLSSKRVTARALTPSGKLLAATVVIWNGNGGDMVHSAPMSASELERAWQALGHKNSTIAWKAVWQLVRVPKQAVPFLKDRLSVLPRTNATQLVKWITELDQGSFSVREQALKSLQSLGRLAEPALKKALRESPGLEARRRIEGLLQRLEIETAPPEVIRWLRAVQVLARIGSSGAQALLQELADGPLLPAKIAVGN